MPPIKLGSDVWQLALYPSLTHVVVSKFAKLLNKIKSICVD
jgi:hypothetical protein